MRYNNDNDNDNNNDSNNNTEIIRMSCLSYSNYIVMYISPYIYIYIYMSATKACKHAFWDDPAVSNAGLVYAHFRSKAGLFIYIYRERER